MSTTTSTTSNTTHTAKEEQKPPVPNSDQEQSKRDQVTVGEKGRKDETTTPAPRRANPGKTGQTRTGRTGLACTPVARPQ